MLRLLNNISKCKISQGGEMRQNIDKSKMSEKLSDCFSTFCAPTIDRVDSFVKLCRKELVGGVLWEMGIVQIWEVSGSKLKAV